jgi:hypothetical protein
MRRLMPLEPEPSNRVMRHLFPTERYRDEWRPHWVRPVKEILLGVALGLVAGRAGDVRIDGDPLPWVPAQWQIWAAVAVWSLWRVAHWWQFRFVITNKRFIVVKGVLSRRTASLPINKVTGLLWGQWPVGWVLNYGSLGFESVSLFHPLHRIRDMPNPNELFLRISEEVHEPAAVEARLAPPLDDDFEPFDPGDFDDLDFEPLHDPD